MVISYFQYNWKHYSTLHVTDAKHLYRCVDVWMYGCVIVMYVLMYVCVDVFMCWCVYVLMCMYRYVDEQMCGWANV